MPRGKNSKKKQNKGKKKVPTKKKGGVYQMGGAPTTENYTARYDDIKDGITVTKMAAGAVGGTVPLTMDKKYIFLAIEADNTNLDSGNIQIKKADKFRLLTTDELKNIELSIDATGANPDSSGGAKAKLEDLLGEGTGAIMKYKSPVEGSNMVSLKVSDVNTQDGNNVPVVRMIVGKHAGSDDGKEVKSAKPADDINNTTYILVIDMSGGRTPEITKRP